MNLQAPASGAHRIFLVAWPWPCGPCPSLAGSGLPSSQGVHLTSISPEQSHTKVHTKPTIHLLFSYFTVGCALLMPE